MNFTSLNSSEARDIIIFVICWPGKSCPDSAICQKTNQDQGDPAKEERKEGREQVESGYQTDVPQSICRLVLDIGDAVREEVNEHQNSIRCEGCLPGRIVRGTDVAKSTAGFAQDRNSHWDASGV
jgi:hypothetical protein